MASGKPVIAPDHTAMEDYIDERVAFVVKSSEELTIWPQDTRIIYRTLRYRPDWGSLKTAYENSYRMAKDQPQEYQRMSARRRRAHAAITALSRRCSKRMADVLRAGSPGSADAATVTDTASC